MFERFRIKTALRREVIRLRGSVDQGGLIRAELLFYEPAFVVADDMKREGWTAEQAMVFMVTDVVVAVEQQGNLAAFALEDPAAYAALRVLYHHVIAKAETDPALAPLVSRPQSGQSAPFASSQAE